MLVKNLYALLGTKLIYIFVLGLIAAVLEIFGLAVIYPFLELIFNSQTTILPLVVANKINDFSNLINSSVEVAVGVVLIALTLLVFLTKSFILKTQLYVGHEIGVYLSEAVLNKKLGEDYERFSSEERSDLTATITARINNAVYNVVIPMALVLTAASFLFLIGGFLIFLSPLLMGSFLAGGFFTYFILYRLSSMQLAGAALVINKNAELKMRAMNYLFNSPKLLFLYGRTRSYIEGYITIDREVRMQQAFIQFEGLSSKFKIEAIILCCAVVSVLSIAEQMEHESILINITMFVVAAQKVIPYFQQLYNNLTLIRGNIRDFELTINVLNEKSEDDEVKLSGLGPQTQPRDFETLELRNVSYAYVDEGPSALTGINLSIYRGEKIAIVGRSGSGKTTLLDVLTTLRKPSGGLVLYNGEEMRNELVRDFRSRLSVVTQQVALTRGTLKTNVTRYSDAEFDEELYQQCLFISGLAADKDNSWYADDRSIDEDSTGISGGQRQRIAIAQALYRRPQILILDEATNGLDQGTQREVISRLFGIQGLTIILVTHRQEPLPFCDRVIGLNQGEIADV